MIRKTDLSKLWYKRGMEIKTPKAYVYLSFNCPESNSSPEATILTYIFTWLLADEMTECGTCFVYKIATLRDSMSFRMDCFFTYAGRIRKGQVRMKCLRPKADSFNC